MRSKQPSRLDNYAKEFKYRLQTMAQTAREILIRNKKKSKLGYDRKINPLEVGIGDKVVVRDGSAHKHEAIYRGPLEVTNINEENVTVKDQNGKMKAVHKNNVNECN